MTGNKIKKCVHGGKFQIRIWTPFNTHPEYEYVFVRCKIPCEHFRFAECQSDDFPNNKKGKEAAIIDWNRKMKQKSKEKGV